MKSSSPTKTLRTWARLIVVFLGGMAFWRYLPELGRLAQTVAESDHFLGTHALASTIVSGIFWPALVLLWLAVNGAIRRLRDAFWPDPLSALFAGESQPHVVLPTMKQPQFQRLGSTQLITLPANAPFVPATFAFGLLNLQTELSRRSVNRDSVHLGYDNHVDTLRDCNIIALGGPFVNAIVKDVMDRGIIPDFNLDDNGPKVIDQKDMYMAERLPPVGGADSPLTKDYGFIVFMRSPWNPARRLCLLWGLWPQGTRGAMDAFLDTSDMRPLARRFRRCLRRERDVIAIVEVVITGLLDGRASIVKCREFDQRPGTTSSVSAAAPNPPSLKAMP